MIDTKLTKDISISQTSLLSLGMSIMSLQTLGMAVHIA
nr:MAG TPA: hypothetical protein [Caudoviricetes sp.]